MELQLVLVMLTVSLLLLAIFWWRIASSATQAEQKQVDKSQAQASEIKELDYKKSALAQKLLSDTEIIPQSKLEAVQFSVAKIEVLKKPLEGLLSNPFAENDLAKHENIISLQLFARKKQQISGKLLYVALTDLKLSFFDGYFCKIAKGKKFPQVQFSLVPLGKTKFDLDNLLEQEYTGLRLFVALEHTSSPMYAFEEMLSVARRLSGKFMGEILDHELKKLTPSLLEGYRDRVRAVQRSKLFAASVS